MNTVTVSSKYQVVIPKKIRDDIGLLSGTQLEIIAYGSRIEPVPIQKLKELKGIFKGINTEMNRDDDRLWILSRRTPSENGCVTWRKA